MRDKHTDRERQIQKETEKEGDRDRHRVRDKKTEAVTCTNNKAVKEYNIKKHL